MKRNRTLLVPCITLSVALVFPLVFAGNNTVIRLGAVSLLYGILAVSLNLISGVAGQISMGHVAFYGIGAYTSAMLAMQMQLPFLLCLFCAFVLSALAGLIIGIPSLRMQGGYLAIISIGFAEIVRLTLLNWKSFTNGAKGLLNIPRPSLFGYTISSVTQSFYFFLFFLVVAYVALSNLISSKFGRNLKAIKSDDIAAEAMGIHVYRSKVTAYVISASIAGVAGSLYAHYMMFISPYSFTSDVSTSILSMVVLGGLGNMYGALIAAIVLTVLPETLRSLDSYRMLIYGVLLVTIMLSKTTVWSETRMGAAVSKARERLAAFRPGKGGKES
ncbi:MAG: branched-chain amino acid ABC transporter permease [Oscillibacter sp.]|jgi:branched-chain amino acid transport system permease protein|nr:branched-chain amino acid ABC transporter permease [Oscillibacter sp.]